VLIRNATASTGSTKLLVQAGPGQNTNNLTEWWNSSSVAMAKVASDGGATFTDLTLSGGVRPVCDAGMRGTFWYAPGAAGVKDTVDVCAKDAANVYGWRAIY
jgi:hypothetical protein